MMFENIEIPNALDFNAIFNTWTAVILGAIGLVFAITIYNSIKSKKDVEETLIEYKKIIEESKDKLKKVEQLENKLAKTYEQNNILSSILLNISEKNYDFAKISLKKILMIEPDNILYNYYYARCSFLSIHNILEAGGDITEDLLKETLNTLDLYLKVSNDITEEQRNMYNLGYLFPNINLYELKNLSHILLNSDNCDLYFGIVKRVLNEIKKELKVETVEDFSYVEHTDVLVMGYRDLLKELGLKMLNSNNAQGIKVLDEYLTIASYSKYYLFSFKNDDILEVLDKIIEFNKHDESEQIKYLNEKNIIEEEIEEHEKMEI